MTREEQVAFLINQINTDPDKLMQLIKFAFGNAITAMSDDRVNLLYNALNPPPPEE